MEDAWAGFSAMVQQVWLWFTQWWWRWRGEGRRLRYRSILVDRPSPRHPIHPKPKWVKQEVIRLKALLPHAGCRTIAHHFNRRWVAKRQMTVSKTYVADTCRRHQYLIYEARRKLKHRVPRPIPRNRIWGCELLTKTDQQGQPHVALALVDHGSRACLPAAAIPHEQVIDAIVAGTCTSREALWPTNIHTHRQ